MKYNPDKKYDILAFAAHPDDIEVAMGGTAAVLAKSNHNLLIVDLCSGEPARHAAPGERAEQARKAAEILGVHRVTLELQDRLICDTPENGVSLAVLIRRHRPTTVFTTHNELALIHPDHAAMGPLVERAVFYARLPKWNQVPGINASSLLSLPPHDIQRLFYYYCRMEPLWKRFDFAIDVSKHYETKRKAMEVYESVFGNTKSSNLFKRIEMQDRYHGEMFQIEYAEIFQSRHPLLLNSIDGILPIPYG